MDQSDPTTEAELEFESLEDALARLHVIPTDLLSGHELRLSEGDSLEALMASAAIPGVFPRRREECAHLASADARRPHAPLPSGVHGHLPRSAIAV